MALSLIDAGDGTHKQISGLTKPAAAFDSSGSVTSVTPTNTGAATYELLIDTGSGYVSQASGLTEAQLLAYTLPSLSAGTYPAKIVATYASLSPVEYIGSVTITASGAVLWSFDADLWPDYSAGAGNVYGFSADGLTLPADFTSMTSNTSGATPNVQLTSSFGGLDGATKALVLQRTGFTAGTGWHADAEVGRDFYSPAGFDQLYFEILFQLGTSAIPWSMGNGSYRYQKLLRIGSCKASARGSDYFSQLGMGILWELTEDPTYGARDAIFMHGGPNYSVDSPPVGSSIFNWNPSAGVSLINYNYTNAPTDLNNDGTVDNNPALVNQLGGTIPTTGYVWADAVFGSGVMHKMAFFVKMNSAIGAQDGEVYQWLDDKLILKNTSIPWKQSYSGTLGASALSTDATITLASGEGANFANLYCNGVITIQISDGTNSESMTVDSASGDVLTVTRGSSTYNFSAGSSVTLTGNTSNFNSIRLGGNCQWSSVDDGLADGAQQPILMDKARVYADIPAGLQTTGNI